MIALLAVFAALLILSAVAVSWCRVQRAIENFRTVERNRNPRFP